MFNDKTLYFVKLAYGKIYEYFTICGNSIATAGSPPTSITSTFPGISNSILVFKPLSDARN